ncbi:hypothetical protein B7Z17_02940 [Candidatus Saccharibacteria bacterium 32-49-10]|nr:MAG: hypothetical protein B7Z17_02940 [Candidatus Saccharibacteria bacterium 32-49-10]
MTSVRAEKILYALLVIIGFAALIGVIFLLSQAESAELAIFELTAFSVSVVAVALAVLGAIASIHQTRAMRRIARDMRAAIQDLKDINKDNESIKRKIGQDYALSRDVAEALTEAGIIEDDELRQKIAQRIERKVRKKTKA